MTDDQRIVVCDAAQGGLRTAPALRRHIFSSGYTVALRLLTTFALKLVGVLIISRILGPAGYGSYVAAYSVYMFALSVGLAAIPVYLTRREGTLTSREIGAAATFLLIASTLIVLLVEALSGLLGAYTNIPGFPEVLRIMAFALPLQALSMPAQALVERRLDLMGVAIIELSTLAAYYACALPLALAGVGPAALAYALVFQSLLTAPIAYAVAGSRPRFGWDSLFILAMLRFAGGFSAANFVLQLRVLVNPFVVGPVLGVTSVGVIGMTIGILEALTQIRTILWRIALAALAPFRSDAPKLRRLIGEGMEIQILAVGAIVLGFGWLGELIVPSLFGARWLPIFRIYPYIALSYLMMSTFSMHTAALTLLNCNWLLTGFQCLNALALAVIAWFAVSTFGIEGYGYAEVGALPSYWALYHVLARCKLAPSFRLAAVWCAAVAVGLFWRQIGPLAIAAPIVALLAPPAPARIWAIVSSLAGPARAKLSAMQS